MDGDDVLRVLDTTLQGLSSEEATQRLELFGPNVVTQTRASSLPKVVLEQGRSPLIYLLFAAMLLTVALGDLGDSAVIAAAIATNTVLGTFQQYKAERAVAELARLAESKAAVMRDGSQLRLDPAMLVPGDVVILESGDNIPADLRIVETSGLTVDESTFTGESVLVKKTSEALSRRGSRPTLFELENIAFTGTGVVSGRASAVVVATGDRTYLGSISTEIAQATKAQTPLQRRFQELSHLIAIAATVVAVAIVVLGRLRGSSLSASAAYAAALIVAAVPEGLPVVVTICMAVGAVRMARKKAVVKRMAAVEALGSVTAIASDKTGTLTENEIAVWEITTAAHTYDFRPSDSRPELDAAEHGHPRASKPPPEGDDPVFDLTVAASVLCNDANRDSTSVDDPIDLALLEAAEKVGRHPERIRASWQRSADIPFDPSRAYMAVAVRRIDQGRGDLPGSEPVVLSSESRSVSSSDDPSARTQIPTTQQTAARAAIFLKGAPEVVFGMCDRVRVSPEDSASLDRSTWEKKVSDAARRGLRVLAIAWKPLEEKDPESPGPTHQLLAPGPSGPGSGLSGLPDEESSPAPAEGSSTEAPHIPDTAEHTGAHRSGFRSAFLDDLGDLDDLGGLELLGLVTTFDPPRPEAGLAVRAAQEAGIKIYMVTGDHPATAYQIAKEVSIVVADDRPIEDVVVTGAQIDATSEADLAETLETVRVVARATPEHKLKIVRALQRRGEVVAVTGDGVNDAPSLKEAQVGIAMGKVGTAVAREAADIVLTDDNFATIYSAVVEGRSIYENIRKAVLFLLPTGLGMVLALGAAFLGIVPLPFAPAQIIWLNLVTNSLQDLALAFEPKEPAIERAPPRRPDEPFISKLLAFRTVAAGTVMAFATLAVFRIAAYGFPHAPPAMAETAAVTSMYLAQNLHLFNSRSHDRSIFRVPPFSNPWIFASIGMAFAAHTAALYWPPLAGILRFNGLPLELWGLAAMFASIVVLGGEVDKAVLRWVRRRRRRGVELDVADPS